MRVAQALGYGRVTGWLKTVFPPVYAQIRLPVYVVLAYSMSVVDVAMILGPSTPPPLSVQIVRWMSDPDLSQRLHRCRRRAAAGRRWCWLRWRSGGWRKCRWRGLGGLWIERGGRGLWRPCPAARWAGAWPAVGRCGPARSCRPRRLVLRRFLGLSGCAAAELSTLRELDAPSAGHPRRPARTTALIALLATAAGAGPRPRLSRIRISQRAQPDAARALAYLPAASGAADGLPARPADPAAAVLARTVRSGPVVLAHLVFVLPYVFLSLGDPWRAWDARNGTVAAALGTSALGRVVARAAADAAAPDPDHRRGRLCGVGRSVSADPAGRRRAGARP